VTNQPSAPSQCIDLKVYGITSKLIDDIEIPLQRNIARENVKERGRRFRCRKILISKNFLVDVGSTANRSVLRFISNDVIRNNVIRYELSLGNSNLDFLTTEDHRHACQVRITQTALRADGRVNAVLLASAHPRRGDALVGGQTALLFRKGLALDCTEDGTLGIAAVFDDKLLDSASFIPIGCGDTHVRRV
jgi:hypothetical protein